MNEQGNPVGRYSVLSGKNNAVPRFAAPKLGRALVEEAPAARDGGGKLYAYHDEAWQPDGEDFYKARIEVLMGDLWVPKHTNDTLQWIQGRAPLLDASPPLDRIRVQNGILDLSAARVRLQEHSVEPLTPVHLPVAYRPEAECPVFTKFLREALPPGVRKTAQEIMGYLLVPDNTMQKAFLAVGGGGNGKTVWVRTICALLGGENYSAHPLHALGDSKFAAADLYGKLANLCADISSHELSSSATFRAITGGDPIQAEHKYKNSFKFTPYARLLFSANKFPPIASPTNALFDRWIVLPFGVRFRGTKQEDKRLLRKLEAPDELSGVLNYALAGLLRLRKQGSFTITPASRRALEDFRLAADTVASFARDHMARSGFYERAALYQSYQLWCHETGHQQMSRTAFYARMREVRGKEVANRGRDGWRVS